MIIRRIKPKFLIYKELEYPEISKLRWVIGFFIWISTSFVFYAFLYISREALRLLSITELYDLWILSDKEVNFYNLFLAFLAVIFAQSACFTFWFDRPNKIFTKKNISRTMIVNDQQFLNGYFIFWFSKFVIVIALFFGATIQGGFYVLNIYPDDIYIFILILIVLFLQTWTTIRKRFKRKSLRWMIGSAIILSISAFGLSKINLIDYNLLNQICLQKNIYHKYNLDLPKISTDEQILHPLLVQNIYVVEPESTSEPQIIINYQKSSLQELHKKITDEQLTFNSSDLPLLTYQLHISRTVKMSFVYELKAELSKLEIRRIAYAVTPLNTKYDIRYYRNFIISMGLPPYRNNEQDNPLSKMNAYENIIKIESVGNERFQIENSIYDGDTLKNVIKSMVAQNTNYIIHILINNNTSFSDYIHIISNFKKAILELRNEYTYSMFKKHFDQVDDEERRKIREKYPLRLYESNNTSSLYNNRNVSSN